jgi:hypothetical protein
MINDKENSSNARLICLPLNPRSAWQIGKH